MGESILDGLCRVPEELLKGSKAAEIRTRKGAH